MEQLNIVSRSVLTKDIQLDSYSMVSKVGKITKWKRKIDYLYKYGMKIAPVQPRRISLTKQLCGSFYMGTISDELPECVHIELIKVDVNNLPALASD